MGLGGGDHYISGGGLEFLPGHFYIFHKGDAKLYFSLQDRLYLHHLFITPFFPQIMYFPKISSPLQYFNGGPHIEIRFIERRFDWDGTYLSTMIPARMALATLRNFGLSSPRLLMLLIDLVKVKASQSRTSLGTASGSTSLSSSSSSHSRLQEDTQTQKISL